MFIKDIAFPELSKGLDVFRKDQSPVLTIRKDKRRYYEKAPKRQLTVTAEGVTVSYLLGKRITNQRKGAV